MKNNVKENLMLMLLSMMSSAANSFLVFLIFIPFPFPFFTFQKSRFAYLISEQVQDCFLLLLKKNTQMLISR